MEQDCIAHLEQGLPDLVDAAEDDGGEEHLREGGCGGLYGGHHRAAGEVSHCHVEEEYCNTKCTNNNKKPNIALFWTKLQQNNFLKMST